MMRIAIFLCLEQKIRRRMLIRSMMKMMMTYSEIMTFKEEIRDSMDNR